MTITERLEPTTLHEQLDHQGHLEDSHGKGCYGLELATPDSVEETHRQWLQEHDVTPPDSLLARVAGADDVAYVGASSNVYNRLMDHVQGEKRQSAFLRVFPPVEVIEVWRDKDAFVREHQRALALSRDEWTVLCDGEIYG